MDITVHGAEKYIFVQQRWKYNWLLAAGASMWTYLERKDFHNKLDRLIWSKWSDQFVVRTSGDSVFAKTYRDVQFRINFDVLWALSNQHWNVQVTKIPNAMRSPTSSVHWGSRMIKLDTKDLLLTPKVARITKVKREIVLNGKQYPAAHEFGHAAGNSIATTHGDEYKATSAYWRDKKSIMHIGDELRVRHADYLVSELNSMISNSRFYVERVR